MTTKKEAFLMGSTAVVLLVPLVCALTTTVTNGNINELQAQQLLTDYGMLKGTITFKLGNYTWPSSEIWLVPDGSLPNQFKSTSTYLELPENVTSSTCKTSVYYNETTGYAFKVLSTQILPNGTFCALAYNGTYNLVAKY